MKVSSLHIHNLRNLAEVSLEPGPVMNLFYGENGAGKTTVLESLLVLAKGRSFRSGRISSLIGPVEPRFTVRATLMDDRGKPRAVALQRNRQDWSGRLDGADLQQISDTASLFPLILMEPTTHQLISGPPDGRRRFLDWTVFHVKHEFLLLWRRFTRVLKQRNAALRARDRRMVEALDPQLTKLGLELNAHRQNVFEQLKPLIGEYLERMSPALAGLELSLNPGWSGQALDQALGADLERDFEQGLTRSGPHRADISIKLRDLAVRERLSRGEQKVLASAWSLAQGKLFRDSGTMPILLLDDLASEFDEKHLGKVVDAGFALGAQMFITGTSCAPYGQIGEKATAWFHVKQGVIKSRNAPP